MINKLKIGTLKTRLAVTTILAGALITGFAPSAFAATYNVTSTADDGSAGTLRWAINQANTAGGNNTITFSVASSSTITLTSTLPAITSNVTINGAGSTGLNISGNNTSTVFQVSTVGASTGPTVTIENLNVENGKNTGANGSTGGNRSGGGGGALGYGGGIQVLDHANVTLSNVSFSGNSATGGNGAAGGANAGANGSGGTGAGGTAGGASGASPTTGTAGSFASGGGGGGGGVGAHGAQGGTGGFGAGAGGTGSGTGFVGGVAGGTYGGGGGYGVSNGGGGGGGGGAGLGGAVFVNDTATLTLTGVTSSGNTATGGSGGAAGAGAGGGGGGTGAGAGLFLRNDATFSDGTFSDSIGGTGGTVIHGGTVTFSGTNTYTGDTTINNGATLSISNNNNLGAAGSSAIVLDSGTLKTTADVTSAHNIILDSSSTLDTNGHNDTFSGNIVGVGDLTKVGTGILTISHGDYIGDTNVSAGTLQAGAANAFVSSGTMVVAASGTVDLNNYNQTVKTLSGDGAVTLGTGTLTLNNSTAGSNSFGGTITGASGSLVQSGNDTFILNNSSTIGTTTVNNGALEVGDSAHSSTTLTGNVSVGGSGTLRGHGTITGSVANYTGTVAPGGSIGTLTVNGNYAQDSSGTLAIEVSPTAASKLVVGGTANLAGTLALTYDAGAYASKDYTILTANSVAGTFSTVTNTDLPSGFNESIIYNPSNVELSLGVSQAGVNSSAALHNDARSSSMNTSHILSDTLIDRLMDNRISDNGADIRTAAAVSQPYDVAMEGSSAQLASLISSMPSSVMNNGGWVRALGAWDHMGATGNNPGYGSTMNGFLAGFDHQLNDDYIIGLAAGYTHSRISENTSPVSDSKVDSPRLYAYGSHTLGNWSFDGTVGYSYNDVDSTRAVGASDATASYGEHEGTAELRASYDYITRNKVNVVPSLGAQYTHLYSEAYSETGAGAFDMSAKSNNSDSLLPYVGVELSKSFESNSGGIITPELRAKYKYETLNNDSQNIDLLGTDYTVDGIRTSRSIFVVGGGVTAALNKDTDLFADYSADIYTTNGSSQTLSAGAKYRF